ncbi:MAG TPA: MBL fold metallo-hydrolase [Clostridiales bacterium]|nr:MBL fold metallo-hydrolase [Clostridiales bacterium]
MQINSMQLGMIGTNCYLFWQEGDPRCAVVDPGDQGELVAQRIESLGLEPVAILLTHGHFDHIMGIPALQARYPQLPVYCHRADTGGGRTTTQLFGSTFPTVCAFSNVRTYKEGDQVAVGPLTVTVMETPGHTPGSVVLRAEGALFTGDTLFRGSVGRTDLEGGSYDQLMASLRRLAALPDDLGVYPGHEGSSTLGEERRSNYYLMQALEG